MATEKYLIARTAAGRAAVSLMAEHEHETGADTLRGLLAGFLVACGEVNGWAATLAEVNELARTAQGAVCGEKPKLIVSDGRIVA